MVPNILVIRTEVTFRRYTVVKQSHSHTANIVSLGFHCNTASSTTCVRNDMGCQHLNVSLKRTTQIITAFSPIQRLKHNYNFTKLDTSEALIGEIAKTKRQKRSKNSYTNAIPQGYVFRTDHLTKKAQNKQRF